MLINYIQFSRYIYSVDLIYGCPHFLSKTARGIMKMQSFPEQNQPAGSYEDAFISPIKQPAGRIPRAEHFRYYMFYHFLSLFMGFTRKIDRHRAMMYSTSVTYNTVWYPVGLTITPP